MPPRPPHTTACMRSRGDPPPWYAAQDAVQDALVKARRELGSTRSVAFTPGCTGFSSTPAMIRPGDAPAPDGVAGSPIDREEPRDDLAELADRDEPERAFLHFPSRTERCRPDRLRRFAWSEVVRILGYCGDRRLTPSLRRVSYARALGRERRSRHPPGARTMNS